MSNNSDVSRRQFLATSTATATTAAVGYSAMTAASYANIKGANERVRIGIIGPGRRGFGAHVKTLMQLRKLNVNLDIVGINDVFTVYRDKAVDFVTKESGRKPKAYANYREMIQEKDIDAVCIATPDHWHAKQTIDSLRAGKHVFCEKPMTHTIEEGHEVIKVWKETGRVLQVGVQSSSFPIWDMARKMIDEGKLGKIVQFQTESARNSKMGMSRHNIIMKEMTPKNIDWKQWLGVKEGLAPEVTFDRSVYGQWRCYWQFGSGMFTDLFVHRVTGMLKATGLRYPGRVVGGGGIFMEYDDREVTDVASLIADYHEGVQGIVSSTMVSEELKIGHIIRGHHGSLLFSKASYGNGKVAKMDFIPERPQVTLNSKLKKETIKATIELNAVQTHFKNFIDAIHASDPHMVNNGPELAAAAVMMVNLAVRSYREGKVFQMDKAGKITKGDNSWAQNWEKMSQQKSDPNHVPGWKAGDTGSKFYPPAYQKLAGPWTNGKPPEQG